MGVFGAVFGRRGDGGFTLAHISGCGGVIGFKVGTWLCVSAKKFALLGPVRTPARKSSPCKPKTAEKRCFQACRASFFAEMRLEGLRWASFFAEMRLEGSRWASFSRNRADVSRAGRTLSRHWLRWHSLRLPVSPARWAARRPQPGRSRPRVAANEPPAPASCGGGRQYEESSSNKQRNRCKRR